MGDALSADRVEYNSVTKALLEKGLALPKRRSVIRVVTIKNAEKIVRFSSHSKAKGLQRVSSFCKVLAAFSIHSTTSSL